MSTEEKEKIDFYKECKDFVESEVYCDITEWVDYLRKTDEFWNDDEKCPFGYSDIECRCWEQADADDEDDNENDEDEDDEYKVEYDPDKEFEFFCAYYVSDWLANKLYEYGEFVVRRQYNDNIWFRDTVGQAICIDWVIGEIVKDWLVMRGRCTREEADKLRIC